MTGDAAALQFLSRLLPLPVCYREKMRLARLFLLSCTLMSAQTPKTRVQSVTETIHGVTITDPYRWLEDQDSPETRAWIESQMGHTQAVLAKEIGRAHV